MFWQPVLGQIVLTRGNADAAGTMEQVGSNVAGRDIQSFLGQNGLAWNVLMWLVEMFSPSWDGMRCEWNVILLAEVCKQCWGRMSLLKSLPLIGKTLRFNAARMPALNSSCTRDSLAIIKDAVGVGQNHTTYPISPKP